MPINISDQNVGISELVYYTNQSDISNKNVVLSIIVSRRIISPMRHLFLQTKFRSTDSWIKLRYFKGFQMIRYIYFIFLISDFSHWYFSCLYWHSTPYSWGFSSYQQPWVSWSITHGTRDNSTNSTQHYSRKLITCSFQFATRHVVESHTNWSKPVYLSHCS